MSLAAHVPETTALPKAKTLRAGLYEGLSFAAYQAIPAVNWSSLRLLDESGVAYQHGKTHPREDTAAMRVGRAVHCAVLEPELFKTAYVVWEGGARRGKDWAEFAIANADREILTESEMDEVAYMRDEVHANPDTRKLLEQKSGRSEITAIWRDTATGARCKGRIDRLNRNTFVDLKTTRSIDARLFGSQAYSMLYHGQMAFYAGGLATLGIDRVAMVVAVNSKAPHESAAFEIPDEALYDGEVLVSLLMAKLHRCHGRYSRRYRGVQRLLRPAWAASGDPDLATGVDDLNIDFGD